jgi:primosomal protein N' (replication factor Y)
LILERFASAQADVLIGTQMIAKGLDLPLVTLVGVVSADTALNLPDFRAAERTFQLLTQVAGRAGRGLLGGRVILQTYNPDHYAIQAAARHDYEAFAERELRFRREQGYPPFRRLARLEYRHNQPERARLGAERLAKRLRAGLNARGRSQEDLIGPAPAFFAKLRDLYRWQIIVRAEDPAELLRHVDISSGWRIDIDPVSVL